MDIGFYSSLQYPIVKRCIVQYANSIEKLENRWTNVWFHSKADTFTQKLNSPREYRKKKNSTAHLGEYRC